jgi:glutamyl/glutaminyl-tRNA synthetase
MTTDDPFVEQVARTNPHSVADVLSLLRDDGWLTGEVSAEQHAWADRAAGLLGHFARDRAELAGLLQLVFHYDAREILHSTEAHAALTRYAARDVVRHLALILLDPRPFTSERFKEVVAQLKEGLDVRSRDLFHPIRLALAGRIGEGELDRVILLVDEAAELPFDVQVKSVRARILEFCAALE